MNIGEILSQDEILTLQGEGKTDKEIKDVARLRLNTPKPPKKKTIADKARNYIKNSDDTGAKFLRGAGTVGLRLGAVADWGAEKVGLDLVDDKKLDHTLNLFEKKKEQTSRAGLSPERLLELKQLDEQSQSATGVWENVKAGVVKAVDVGSHPSEWTVQGVTEGVGDPTNLISLGFGGLAAKFGTSLATKVIYGGAGGAVEGAVVTSATEYAVERGRGHSEDEATKVAIQSGAGGGAAGSAFGSMGGAFSHKTVKDNIKTTSNEYHNDIERDILNNPLLNDEETTKATKHSKVDDKYKSETVNVKETTQPKDPNFILVHENLPALANELVEAEIVEPDAMKEITHKATKQIADDVKVAGYHGWAESVGQHIVEAINAKAINKVNEVEQTAKSVRSQEKVLIEQLIQDGVKPTEVKKHLNSTLVPSEDEVKYTFIINDGRAIENRFAGARLKEYLYEAIQKEQFKKDELNSMLLEAGANDELAKVASDSYASKDITMFDDFMVKKLQLAQEHDNAKTIESVKSKLDVDNIDLISKQYHNNIEIISNKLKEHPRYDELIEFTKELSSTDSVHPKRLLKKSSRYDSALYEPNYAHGFSLTKAKVQRIQKGTATKNDLADLKNDLGIMEQDQRFNTPAYKSIVDFNKKIKQEDPQRYEAELAEADAVFGNEETENIQYDTDRPSILERDSKHAELDLQMEQDSVLNDTTRDSEVPGQSDQRDRTKSTLSEQDDNSLSGGVSSSNRTKSDNSLHQRNETDKSKTSVSGDKLDNRSDRADEARTQTDNDTSGGVKADVNTPSNDTNSKTDNVKNSTTSGLDLAEKLKLQEIAEEYEVVEADADNIALTLPIQLPHQQTNTLKAETRFFIKNKKGMLFTDGTGTGKTYTGLGIAKRFEKKGKKNILIVTPTDKKVKDWIGDAQNLRMKPTQLKGVNDAGDGTVVTTYANFYQNKALLSRDFDLVIYDESHYLMQNNRGEETASTKQHFAITNGRDYEITQRAESRVIPADILDFETFNNMNESLNEKFDIAGKILFHKDIETLADLDKHLQQHRIELSAKQKRELFNRAITQKDKQQAYFEAKREMADEIDEEIARLKSSDIKVVFLSATPFKGHFNLRYAMGYLFDVAREDGMSYNSGSGEQRFFIENFGYKMRYNKLTKPDAEIDVSLMERRFADSLKTDGALSGYTIIGDKDYSREFVKVGHNETDKMGRALDAVFDFKSKKYDELSKYVRHRFWDYLESNQMYEAMKAKYSIPMLKKHIQAGRQIVVFHKYNQTSTTQPFKFDNYSYTVNSFGRPTKHSLNVDTKALEQWGEFKKEFADVVDIKGFNSVIYTLKKEFGDDVVLFNGSIANKVRSKNVDDFNSGQKKIIVIQEQAGKEGISLHDIKGDAQRVLINMALPYDPIAGIQIEGRTFRIGVKSDAIYQYPILGFKLEEWQFGTEINKRLGTTENLSLGSDARALADTFKESFLNSIDESEAHLSTGKGGKVRDRTLVELSAWEIAKSDYYSNAKKTSRNKSSEGIDYFATPEPLGFKMVEWADILANDDVLEPSAGHGAIARYFPSNSKNKMIELSSELVGKLSLRAKGEIINSRFEDHNIINKYDTIVMNPPFGTAGKMAMEHLDKAYKHLKDGGRVVALIPDGASMQKRLNKWLYAEDKDGKLTNDASLSAEVLLPSSTFERAGTKVIGRVVVIDKAPADFTKTIDLRDSKDNKEFFSRLEHISLPNRKKKDTDVSIDELLDDSSIKVIEDIDTRDDSTIYVAKLQKQLDKAEFNKAKELATTLGGYWSRFKSGFIFPTKEKADSFKSEGC